MTKGVVYIAAGDKFIQEATVSANSLKKHNPNIPITIFSDQSTVSDVFDEVISFQNPAYDYSDSILGQQHFPYDYNLFLDTDTYICSSIEDIFEILDRSELAAAFDPTRTGQVNHTHENQVPDTFPQYNTGVIAYRDCKSVRELFDYWGYLCDSMEGIKHNLNQPPFRKALFESEINIGTLPPEWNFRVPYVGFAGDEINIIHGRSTHCELEQFDQIYNKTDGMRVVTKEKYPRKVIGNSSKSIQYRVADIIHFFKTNNVVKLAKNKRERDGTRSLLRSGVDEVKKMLFD